MTQPKPILSRPYKLKAIVCFAEVRYWGFLACPTCVIPVIDKKVAARIACSFGEHQEMDARIMSAPFQQGNGFQVMGLGEHVDGLHLRHGVTLPLQYGQVPDEGGRFAGYVKKASSLQGGKMRDYLCRTLSGRIEQYEIKLSPGLYQLSDAGRNRYFCKMAIQGRRFAGVLLQKFLIECHVPFGAADSGTLAFESQHFTGMQGQWQRKIAHAAIEIEDAIMRP